MASPTPRVSSGFTAFVDIAGKTGAEVVAAAKADAPAADVNETWQGLAGTLARTVPSQTRGAHDAARRIRSKGGRHNGG